MPGFDPSTAQPSFDPSTAQSTFDPSTARPFQGAAPSGVVQRFAPTPQAPGPLDGLIDYTDNAIQAVGNNPVVQSLKSEFIKDVMGNPITTGASGPVRAGMTIVGRMTGHPELGSTAQIPVGGLPGDFSGVEQGMEALGIGRQPGESDTALNQRYEQARQTAIQNAQQNQQQNTVGAYDGNPLHAAERFGQQAINTAGSLTANPQYLAAPGMGLGPNVAARIASSAAGNAALSAASDASAQLMDMAQDQQKNFDIEQNLKSAALGGLAGGLMHGAAEIPIPDFVKNLFATRGMDTLPAANPTGSTIQPMTQDHIALNAADHVQLQQLLQTGSVDDIKNFFQGRQGPQPSWQSVNRFVSQRDNPNFTAEPSPIQNPRAAGGGEFNYNDQYNAHAEQQWGEQNRQAVEDQVNQQMAGWKNAPEVNVVRGPEELGALGENVPDSALGMYGADGRVHIFSDRVANEGGTNTANSVIFHEGLGHFGLQQVFGDKLDSVMSSLVERNVNGLATAAKAYQKANTTTDENGRVTKPTMALSAEEVLATRSQSGNAPVSWKDALSGMVNRFGRKMGMKIDYSDGEVAQIVAMAHDAVRNGKVDPRANHYMGTDSHITAARQKLEAIGAHGDINGQKFMFTGKNATGYNPFDQSAYRSSDGVRNEIDDSNAKLIGHGDTLGETLDHPELYRQYPELRNVTTVHRPFDGPEGAYDSHLNTMYLQPHASLGTVLHETQHAIQNIEQYPHFQQLAAEGGSMGMSDDEARAHPVEAEAIATDDRQKMDQATRNSTPPKFMRTTDQHPLGYGTADPRDLDDIDRLKQDPRFWTDREYRANIAEMARVRSTQETGPDTNKYMRGPSDPENEDYGRLPITDKDIRISRSLRGMIMHHDDPNGLNRFSDIENIRDRYAREYGDVPPEQVDRIVRDYKNMNVGQEHPDLSKTINVYDNTRGEIIKKFDNRRDALSFIDDQPNRQDLGIDRYGTDNKFITRAQLNAARSPDYKSEDPERVFTALNQSYSKTSIPSDELRENALKAGISPKDIKDLETTDPGELASRVYRLGAATNLADAKLRELEERIGTPKETKMDKIAYVKALADFQYMATRFKGETSEAGRALNFAQNFPQYTNASLKEIGDTLRENGQEGLARLAEDDEAFNKFVKQLQSVRGQANTNPQGVQALLSQVQKPNWEQYATTLHMNMMLSALSTHVKAPADMATGIARNVLEKVMAMPVGKARQLLMTMFGKVPKPGVELAELHNHIYGLLSSVTDAEMWKATLHAARTGEGSYVTPRLDPNTGTISSTRTPTKQADQYGSISSPRWGQNGGLPGNGLLGLVNKPGDLISAQDTFFRSTEMNAQLMTVATREARSELGPQAKSGDVRALGKNMARNPTNSMIKEAYDNTQRTLLLNDNPMNRAINRLRTVKPGANPGQRLVSFVTNALAPFIRVESNSLLNRIIQRSPLGLVDPTGYTQAQLKMGGAQGDIALTKMLYGTALYALAWNAGNFGLQKLTGAGPDNVNKFKQMQAGGWRPNAVQENGKFNTGGVLGMSVLPWDMHNRTAQMVQAAHQAWDAGMSQEGVGTAIKLSLGSVFAHMANQSWLSDIDPAISALMAHGSEAQSTVSRFASNEAQSWAVPAIAGQAARIMDPNQRDITDPNHIGGSMSKSIAEGYPGLRENLPIKYSVYGTPLQNGQSFVGVHTMIPGLSGNGTTETADPTERELDRLNAIEPNGKAVVTPVQRTVTVDGSSYHLSPQQFETYQQTAGLYTVQGVRDLIGSGQWDTMDDKERATAVTAIEKGQKTRAREELFGQ